MKRNMRSQQVFQKRFIVFPLSHNQFDSVKEPQINLESKVCTDEAQPPVIEITFTPYLARKVIYIPCEANQDTYPY